MPAASSGQSFCAAHSTMPRGSFPVFSSSPWPDLPAGCPAYAPTTTSPARYSAGRAKQHNHARNVKPLPPRRSPGRTLPGQEGVKGDTCLSPSPFSLPFGKKRKDLRSSMHCRLNQCRTPPLLLPYPRFPALLPALHPLKAIRLVLTDKRFPAQPQPQLEPPLKILLLRF